MAFSSRSQCATFFSMTRQSSVMACASSACSAPCPRCAPAPPTGWAHLREAAGCASTCRACVSGSAADTPCPRPWLATRTAARRCAAGSSDARRARAQARANGISITGGLTCVARSIASRVGLRASDSSTQRRRPRGSSWLSLLLSPYFQYDRIAPPLAPTDRDSK
jgi:hypothetical protein